MTTSTLRRSIQTEIKRLAAIADTLSSEGLEDEAKSLETTIADLRWQCEEFEIETASTASTLQRTK